MSNADTIYRHLLKRIKDSGGVPVRLDSEPHLAAQFEVSRWVARGVLHRLVREGFAVAQRGRGYFARPSKTGAQNNRMHIGIVHGPAGKDGLMESATLDLLFSLLIGRIQDAGMGAKLLPTQGRRDRATLKRIIDETPVDAYLLCSVLPEFQAMFVASGRPTVVVGNTFDDLGVPSVAFNMLELTRSLTERLFSSGHNRVCLIQEHTSNLGWERSRIGFEYAHHARRIRFKRERIIRLDRRRYGLRPAMQQLSLLAPTGILIQSVDLLEQLWRRADVALQKILAEMEAIVLSPNKAESLSHPAQIVQSDPKANARVIVQVLVAVLNGRTPRKRHHDLPWTLISKS